MKLKNKELWDQYVEKNNDPYGSACIKVAEEVMKILDNNQEFDAHDIIIQGDNNAKTGGITGFMAGAVASMVSQCHERGDEFRAKWNKSYGSNSKEGTVNPAILTIDTK